VVPGWGAPGCASLRHAAEYVVARFRPCFLSTFGAESPAERRVGIVFGDGT
jgi:hypothetical protein